MHAKTNAAAAALLLVALLSFHARAVSSTTASNLGFAAPEQIANNAVQHRSALFGSSNFGELNHIIGKITPLAQNQNDTMICPTTGREASQNVDILMLDGWPSCTFVQEAVFAQERLGAKALIVLEDRCMRANKDKTPEFAAHCASLCSPGEADSDCYLSKLNYMGGSSHDVHIPAMIVSRWDGLLAMECYAQQRGDAAPGSGVTGVSCAKGGPPPLVELRWNLAQTDRVEFELWTSSLLNADIFVRQAWWEVVVPLLAGRTIFRPRYFVWDGEELSCRYNVGEQPHQMCRNACHSLGRYCHYDPDGLDNDAILGEDLSRENLRQLCLFRNLQQQHERAGGAQGDQAWAVLEQKWWHYVSDFAANCTDGYHASCSESVHRSLKLDWAATMQCVKASGNYEDDSGENTILAEELAMRSNLEIQKLPTLIVNGKIIEFGASLKDVLSAMCAGFKEPSRPDFCPCAMSSDATLYNNDAFVSVCLRSQPPTPYSGGGGSSSSSSGVGLGMLLVILLTMAGCLVSCFAVYRQRERSQLRSEFHEDIRNIMGEYMRMDNNGTAEAPSTSASFIGEPLARDGADSDGAATGRSGYERVVELS